MTFRVRMTLLGAIAALGFSCTGASAEDLSAKVPQALMEKGTLVIGTSIGYPPYMFYDKDGTTLLGYEPELMAIWAKSLGLGVDWKSASFASLFSGLESKRYDILLNGVVDTEERRQKYLLVDYAKDGWTVVFPKGNPKNITEKQSLCGLRAGVIASTSQVNIETISKECEAAGKKGIEISVFDADTAGLLALRSGRVDVVSVQSPSGAYYVKENPDQFELLASENFKPGAVAFILPKGEAGLAEAIRGVIQASIDDGSYAKVMEAWGMSSLSVDKATIHGDD
ncbi:MULTISPECIES: ABC transporter substrate-binding protein [unclassified Rhizobium]|uniref:ABC transporter substrate-binding protein n=1 Tax=unclassified Rhizobium TaxID=2613769 RepID=UPI0006FEBF1B|nr:MULTISPECIES: ABC transporter substrate-binding protein [unclassified Rhizobium]KQV39372.1 hypothetical protein ASC86_22825 [Rhizobium sp. Root1212]KRD35377.1 hypothetical protein ASE37_21395 [Rhizobium sp. Root268]